MRASCVALESWRARSPPRVPDIGAADALDWGAWALWRRSSISDFSRLRSRSRPDVARARLVIGRSAGGPDFAPIVARTPKFGGASWYASLVEPGARWQPRCSLS